MDGQLTPQERPLAETTPGEIPAQPREAEPVVETSPQHERAAVHEQPSASTPVAPSVYAEPISQAPVKSGLEKEIEAILAEDLEAMYWDLPEAERMIFKHKGEETASKIRLLLGEATVRVQEIFRLLVEWLQLLPGVSRLFIEQEAKIKTDKVMKFKNPT